MSAATAEIEFVLSISKSVMLNMRSGNIEPYEAIEKIEGLLSSISEQADNALASDE